MVLGLGTDLVDVPRIAHNIEQFGDKFTHRVFTAAERDYAESKANVYERFAARFAAKEAAMKALGTGLAAGISWTEIEVRNDASGKPSLHLDGVAQEIAAGMGVKRVSVSLTHTRQQACAVVIFED